MLDDDGRPMRRSPRNAHIVPGRVIAYTRREALVEWWPDPCRRGSRLTWLPRSDVVGELHLVDEHGRGRDG